MDNTRRTCRGCSNPCGVWIKICRFYNHIIEMFFEKLGKCVANHPLVVVLLCVIIIAALASGSVFMETENRSEKLYIPQQSESITNLEKAKAYGFYRPSRLTEVILLNEAGKNVLIKECFQDAISLHHTITNITGYTKLCLPKGNDAANSSSGCLTRDPLMFFNYSSRNLDNILLGLNKGENATGLKLDGVLGRISRDSANQITSANGIRLVYFIKGAGLGDKISEETLDWEKKFLDKMKESDDRKCGSIFYTTGRSLDDAITESTLSDTKLISITFTIMIGFSCFMLAKYRNPLTGHGLLAMSGVACVGLGIMAAFGLAMFCQVPFISIVGILPFLIVGVGIDDMFIIVDELDRSDPDLPIPVRLSKVMRSVGPAITMTSITDLVAFAVGTTSKFPSIVYFCIYAALAILFSFCFLVTIFVSFMNYDCKRMKAGRRDMVPCLKAPPPIAGNRRWDEPLPQTSNKIMEFWGRLLMKPFTKGFVVILSVALLAVGIYGSTFINEEFDRRDLAKDGSEFVNFVDAVEEYFLDDIEVDVILENGLNYSDPSTQEGIANLYDIIKNNHYYRPHVISWLNEFQKWSRVNNDSTNFIDSLEHFLRKNPRFRSDILFSKDKKTIMASRLQCFIKQAASSVTLRDAMTSLRSDFSKKSDLPVFSSAFVFIFFEQFVSTFPETIRNIGSAAAAILLVTTLFLVNPLVVFLVLMSFASLICELLGLMYVWGVSLNSISMINLVMAIGFAVDYSAHIAHHFVFSAEKTPEDKVIDSLRTVGASVFMGGLSTFLGMVVTGFASAEIFRIFFKMFFGIVVLGLLHGLCFLPVWLALICRVNLDINSNSDEGNLPQNPPWPSNGAIISPMSDNHDKSKHNKAIDFREMHDEENLPSKSLQNDNVLNTSILPKINSEFDPKMKIELNKEVKIVEGDNVLSHGSVNTKL